MEQAIPVVLTTQAKEAIAALILALGLAWYFERQTNREPHDN